MNYLALSLQTTIILSISIPVFVGLVLLVIFLEIRRSKHSKTKPQTPSASKTQPNGNINSAATQLIKILGGDDNLSSLAINNHRVTAILKDQKLLDLDSFHKLNISSQISDKTIKMYISDQKIIDSLNSRG